MRGGAIPLLAWAALLALMLAINWVWTGDALQVGDFAFAVLMTVATAGAFVALRPREALRRGPPPPSDEPQAIPSASYGAVLLAVGAASAVYGLAFGRFLIFFGLALMVLAAGVLAREKRHQRLALRHWREGRKE